MRLKDDKNGGDWRTTDLDALEFVRRFLLHALPRGFQRIRYYRLFASRWRAANLERCRALLGVPPNEPKEKNREQTTENGQERLLRLTGIDARRCPVCGEGELVVLWRP